MPAAAAKSKKSAKPDPLAEVFVALRKLMLPHARKFRVMHDREGVYYLECKQVIHRGKPLFVAGVRRGKSYVSVYFMPIYCWPAMRQSLSPALRKRLGGKACFNFKKVEPELFDELSQVIDKGLGLFAKIKDVDELLQGRTYA